MFKSGQWVVFKWPERSEMYDTMIAVRDGALTQNRKYCVYESKILAILNKKDIKVNIPCVQLIDNNKTTWWVDASSCEAFSKRKLPEWF